MKKVDLVEKYYFLHTCLEDESIGMASYLPYDENDNETPCFEVEHRGKIMRFWSKEQLEKKMREINDLRRWRT